MKKLLDSEIIKLAKLSPGLDVETVIQHCKKNGLRPLSPLEWDDILQDDERRQKYYDFWPAWTGTKLSYKKGEEKAILREWGKKPRPIYLPLKDGYYEVDEKTGIPNGKPSQESNKKARYLYRWQDRDWEGLLARGGCGDFRRGVDAIRLPSDRLGVLAVKDETAKPHKHDWETKCRDCGKEKKKR